MTASDALEVANNAALGARLRFYEAMCMPRGACQREPLKDDPGRWTWCPDCLTLMTITGSL
jgi:hypothetical protein